jgi:NADPH2:quinone reductase
LIDYKTEDVRERVLDLTGRRGVNVVYDPVGGDIFDASLRCTISGGRILLVGFASGKVPQIPANIMLVKNVDVMGIYFGAMRMADPDMVQKAFAEMMDWYDAGDLRPHVSGTFPLENAVEALRMLSERRSTGKVVLTN